MSTKNRRVCFNCGHCIREKDKETLHTRYHCEIHREFRPYINVMTGWCKHWAKEKDVSTAALSDLSKRGTVTKTGYSGRKHSTLVV